MFLHNDKELFQEVIVSAADYWLGERKKQKRL